MIALVVPKVVAENLLHPSKIENNPLNSKGAFKKPLFLFPILEALSQYLQDK